MEKSLLLLERKTALFSVGRKYVFVYQRVANIVRPISFIGGKNIRFSFLVICLAILVMKSKLCLRSEKNKPKSGNSYVSGTKLSFGRIEDDIFFLAVNFFRCPANNHTQDVILWPICWLLIARTIEHLKGLFLYRFPAVAINDIRKNSITLTFLLLLMKMAEK